MSQLGGALSRFLARPSCGTHSVRRTDARKSAAVTRPGSPLGSARAQIEKVEPLLPEANSAPYGNQYYHTPEPAFAGARLDAVNRTRSASGVDDGPSRVVESRMRGT
jgi:hypothetical protein